MNRRVCMALVPALLFGLVVGFFKGDDTGLRGGLGNLSAPWLLVALLPAWKSRKLAAGAAVGFATTLVALVGFYSALTVVLDGHLGGGGLLSQFAVEAHANAVYFVAGSVTGPVCGLVGAWLGGRRSSSAWLVAGGLLALEIVVVALAQGRQLVPPPLYLRWGVDDWTPYIVECAVGVTILTASLLRLEQTGAEC